MQQTMMPHSTYRFRETRKAGGNRFRFFSDQTYHFQTLRALSETPYGEADTSEILETIGHIKVGDADSWYRAWERVGDRVDGGD